jgi:hypothetical protein
MFFDHPFSKKLHSLQPAEPECSVSVKAKRMGGKFYLSDQVGFFEFMKFLMKIGKNNAVAEVG